MKYNDIATYNGVNWYKVDNDINGNSRIVVEYTQFLTSSEIATRRAKAAYFNKYRGRGICGFIAQTMAVSNGSEWDIARVILEARNK